MSKKNLTLSIMIAVFAVLALAACGSGSTARIVEQVDTATSFTSAEGGFDQMNVAMADFASSFSADFAAMAGEQINAVYEGNSANVAANIDVLGGAFESASVAAEDATSGLSASFNDPEITASLNAYREAFASEYAEAYAAEFAAAASLSAEVVSADIMASLSADLEGLDEGFGGTSIELEDGGMFSAAVEQAYASGYAAASTAASVDLPLEGSSNSVTLLIGSVFLLGIGFVLGQYRKK